MIPTNNGMTAIKMALLCGLAAVIGLMVLVGCGKETPNETKDRATLEGVSLQYWNHRLVNRDYQATYDRELDHASMSFEDYRKLVSRNENLKFSDLSLGKVTIENDAAIVEVNLKASAPQIALPIERTFKDEWMYQSGQWKHRFSETQP